jgi:phosphoribosylanthranilate isomerase
VQIAAALGVDALGFVMVPSSKRALSIDQARALVQASPAMVSAVGLFQNQSAEFVRAAIGAAGFSLLQFHGNEDNVFCASFGLPFIKAVPMADSPDLLQCAIAFAQAGALLLDSHSLQGDRSGGSGHVFDWSVIPTQAGGAITLSKPVILAGGLTAEMVAVAMQERRFWAVDVSSGIESAPGIKDASKMRDFVKAVQRADVIANSHE